MTFWETHENYGQMLQAKALQLHLEDKGHQPYLIKYDKSHSVKASKPTGVQNLAQKKWQKLLNPVFVFKKVIALIKKLIVAIQRMINPSNREFARFKANKLSFNDTIYNSPEEIKANPPEADVYIVGSDQVWNYQFLGDPSPFFLQFGAPTSKRVAYAASFGHRELPEDVDKKYSEYLKSFDAVSVREESGVSLCKAMGRQDAILVPDPTMLIPRSRWVEQSQDVPGFSDSDKKKVFIYTIGKRSSSVKDELLKYAKSMPDAEIAHVSINGDAEGKQFPTIEEWLGYYKAADLVITNSYHGMIFSIIFNNQFLAIAAAGSHAGMNERPLTLMGKFGLEKHLLFDYNQAEVQDLIDTPVDWDAVNQKIGTWTGEAKGFLDFDKLYTEMRAVS